MPHRDLHLQRVSTVPEVLRDKHSSLLANKQCRAVSIAPDVVRADGQVGAFETLDAVDVEAFVQDTVFDDRVAFAGGHRACAET